MEHRARPLRSVRDVDVPAFFYGTAWKEERTQALTAQALRAGFRAIDTANQRRHYVEAAVGDAVRAALESGALARSDVFLQTKFTFARGQDQRIPYDPHAAFAAQVEQSFESSLEHLGVTSLDSYLLHGPWSGSGLDRADWEVWSAFEALHASGRVRLLGVSNVSLEQLELLHRRARVKPAFVQNRCYARTGWDREVRAFCRANDVAYQAFSLLTANGRELQSRAVRDVAARLQATPAQVVFSYALEVGMIPLTGSSDPEHLRQDLACFELELDERELTAIENVSG
jgi:diketogulonate reductase-like aldo/keto reductase